jgi:hypothetical protein
MSFKLSGRSLWFVLLAISGLRIAVMLIPILYSILFPRTDFRKIVQSLEANGSTSLGADTAIQKTIANAGRLRRAVQISSYSGVTVTFRLGENHTAKKSQAGYVAWFENRQRPVFLLIQQIQIDDSVKTYEIAEGDSISMIRTFGFALLIFIVSLYMATRKKPISVNDPTLKH